MLKDFPVVAIIEDEDRILVGRLARLKLLNGRRLTMNAAENTVIVVEEFFEVARRDSYTRVAGEALRNEKRMMRRLRHDGARETLGRYDGPLFAQTFLEK